MRLVFAAGTLEVHGEESASLTLPDVIFDERTGCLRAPAVSYAKLVRALVGAKVPFEDQARRYANLTLEARVVREPRFYQSEALEAWERARGRGVVVLPTGAGKTQVAIMAMLKKQRSTLVVAPTLELVRQWHDTLAATFRVPVGIVGGGSHQVEDLTVTTYDSAHLHMDHLGSRFGLVVFDECHHLPSDAYKHAALSTIAPFRLGLTATPERTDGREAMLATLVGDTVYRKDIVELSGSWLADYDVERIFLPLDPDERAEYDASRRLYRTFIAKHQIRMSGPQGFATFIVRASQTREGHEAMAAFRRQKALAFTARAKLATLEELLHRHRDGRTILFTSDNATAYTIALRFLVPIITHQTKVRERIDILNRFRSGEYSALVTSKVLNEGVDVPEASVAIIVSGSGSIREHVQRLGRVLRKSGTKHAVLYELVTEATTEEHTSERRREHSAYR